MSVPHFLQTESNTVQDGQSYTDSDSDGYDRGVVTDDDQISESYTDYKQKCKSTSDQTSDCDTSSYSDGSCTDSSVSTKSSNKCDDSSSGCDDGRGGKGNLGRILMILAGVILVILFFVFLWYVFIRSPNNKVIESSTSDNSMLTMRAPVGNGGRYSSVSNILSS